VIVSLLAISALIAAVGIYGMLDLRRRGREEEAAQQEDKKRRLEHAQRMLEFRVRKDAAIERRTRPTSRKESN